MLSGDGRGAIWRADERVSSEAIFGKREAAVLRQERTPRPIGGGHFRGVPRLAEHFTCINSVSSLPHEQVGTHEDAEALNVWGKTGLSDLQFCEIP